VAVLVSQVKYYIGYKQNCPRDALQSFTVPQSKYHPIHKDSKYTKILNLNNKGYTSNQLKLAYQI